MRDIRCVFRHHEFVRVENYASRIRDGAIRYLNGQSTVTEIDGMKFIGVTHSLCARKNCIVATTHLVPAPDQLVYLVTGANPPRPNDWVPLSERPSATVTPPGWTGNIGFPPAGIRGAGISRVREGHASSAQKPRPSWGYEPQSGVAARTGHRRSTHWDGFDEMFNPALYPVEILNEKGEVIGHGALPAGAPPPPSSMRGVTPDFVVVDEVAQFVATPEEAEAIGRGMLDGLSVDKPTLDIDPPTYPDLRTRDVP